MRNIFTGLTRTRVRMTDVRATDNLWNDWRDRLIMADVGVAAADDIIRETQAAAGAAPAQAEELTAVLGRRLRRLEAMLTTEGRHPYVVIVMGVNGGGKTTTIAKLSRYFVTRNKKVLLAAGDTFRAAAREQLEIWGKRLGGLEVISETGDPAAVAFNAVRAGIARDVDVVIIDTAGRLPTQRHLMAELAKIRRAVGKALPGAPHELLLVLDATVGQNALAQLLAFREAVGVSGLVIAKLDGSAKGGFLLPLAAQAPTPVRFLGVGEGDDDLILFNADVYAAALVGEEQAAAG